MIKAEERRRSAALRAVSGDAGAELRGLRLKHGHRPSPVNSPYLSLVTEDGEATRAVADALAMILRHNDPALHVQLRPEGAIERVVFDTLEQLRCQSLAPDLPGIRSNLAAVGELWCARARAEGVAESGVGLLVYTLTHMVRARLRLGSTDETVDSIIEGPRARLARLVGHALKRLQHATEDQARYAEASSEIARLVAEMAGDASESGDAAENLARYRMLVPPTWTETDDAALDRRVVAGSLGMASADLEALDSLGGYRVFTRAHDTVVRGDALYLPSILRRTRTELDDSVRAQAVSAQRLARRLRSIFATQEPTGWEFAQPEGVIDARRLAQLASSIDPTTLFRRPQDELTNNTAIAILMDNSGSMKSHRFEMLATLADTLSRALDLAGVTNEILGHTTASWSGGRALADWRAEGEPSGAGRVADLAHIIYKDADTPWRRARRSLAAMANPRHFRESVDGEAVIWAHKRLLGRPERRKILVVVSDGAPAESGTAIATGSDSYLGRHFAEVVSFIEQKSPVEIAAFSTGGSVDSVFANSVTVDFDSTLTLADYAALEVLFK